MEGIQFVVDGKGDKVAVQIDLHKYGAVWEDFYDMLLARGRAAQPREPLEQVRTALREQGKLDA